MGRVVAFGPVETAPRYAVLFDWPVAAVLSWADENPGVSVFPVYTGGQDLIPDYSDVRHHAVSRPFWCGSLAPDDWTLAAELYVMSALGRYYDGAKKVKVS